MKRVILFIGYVSFILAGLCNCTPKEQDPQLVGFDFKELQQTRKKIQQGDKEVMQAFDNLTKRADSYLLLEAEKVTDGDIPPSGNKHDFFAIGKYSWPNPETADGMPWIRIDCDINPEANGPRFDLARYNNTVDRVKELSLAWFYSRDEKYAEKAAQLLRVWFIDEETRMNPNFECASALPGVYNGMAIGIIFGVTLVEMVDHVKLLMLSESWSVADNNALKDWFSGYVDWLLTSEFGIKEKKARNNHGTWYSAQIAAYSLYTGKLNLVRDMVEFGKQQIEEQVAFDGSLPAELKRDWAFSYSVYGMRAFTALALCGDQVGIDLWNYQTKDGRGLRQAYEFLVPYLAGKEKWIWGVDREDENIHHAAQPMIKWAAKKYNSDMIQELSDYLMSFIPFSCNDSERGKRIEEIDKTIEKAVAQVRLLANDLFHEKDKLPRTTDKDGKLVTANSAWWTSGFFPGTLWYLYELTRDEELLDYAKDYTARVEKEQYTTDNHDVGFMLYCSFGNGYRLTKNEQYKKVLLQGAESLSTRFNKKIGLIRSWDWNKEVWKYPVIIDNMMNLELLEWASRNSDNIRYAEIARSHADVTMKYHFRDNYSCYHVVSYDPETGLPELRQTRQGYADESTWARGEAWALYGYVMMYRETGEKRYLDQAKGIAGFILNHPRLPEDKVPYWDFDTPDIPNAKRDASAASIMASAFIELSTMTEGELSEACIKTAEKQIETLSSDEYFAQPGTNGHFILKHSVGDLPRNSEVDVPLTYADYYFIEALLRYKQLVK